MHAVCRTRPGLMSADLRVDRPWYRAQRLPHTGPGGVASQRLSRRFGAGTCPLLCGVRAPCTQSPCLQGCLVLAPLRVERPDPARTFTLHARESVLRETPVTVTCLTTHPALCKDSHLSEPSVGRPHLVSALGPKKVIMTIREKKVFFLHSHGLVGAAATRSCAGCPAGGCRGDHR